MPAVRGEERKTMTCEKCGRKDGVNLWHVNDESESTKHLCYACVGSPEYGARCPHCDAMIPVN